MTARNIARQDGNVEDLARMHSAEAQSLHQSGPSDEPFKEKCVAIFENSDKKSKKNCIRMSETTLVNWRLLRKKFNRLELRYGCTRPPENSQFSTLQGDPINRELKELRQ